MKEATMWNKQELPSNFVSLLFLCCCGVRLQIPQPGTHQHTYTCTHNARIHRVHHVSKSGPLPLGRQYSHQLHKQDPRQARVLRPALHPQHEPRRRHYHLLLLLGLLILPLN